MLLKGTGTTVPDDSYPMINKRSMTEAERILIEVAIAWRDWHPSYSWLQRSDDQLCKATDRVRQERKKNK